MTKLQVLDYEIDTKNINNEDYVSLTDLAKYVDKKDTYLLITGQEVEVLLNFWDYGKS